MHLPIFNPQPSCHHSTTPSLRYTNPPADSLLVNLVDEAAFFQLPDDAFINQVFEP
jgi:hypothetical protein